MLFGFTYAQLAVAVGVFVASTAITTFIVGWFLVGIRHDYFVAGTRGMSRRISSPWARALYFTGKNVLGVVLIAVGIVLSLPGVPGQGLLTILVGVLLLDVPGKRRLELRVVRRPKVAAAINRLRARFDKPPLDLASDDEDASDAPQHSKVMADS